MLARYINNVRCVNGEGVISTLSPYQSVLHVKPYTQKTFRRSLAIVIHFGMENFQINEKYLTSVTISEVIKFRYDSPEDELIAKIKYPNNGLCIRYEDHPEFLKLREKLGSDGYIKIERGWSNGDRVVKPFTLNGEKFSKGDRFVCAAAMKHHITSIYKR